MFNALSTGTKERLNTHTHTAESPRFKAVVQNHEYLESLFNPLCRQSHITDHPIGKIISLHQLYIKESSKDKDTIIHNPALTSFLLMHN